MKVSIIIPAYNEAEGVSQTSLSLRPALENLRTSYELEVIFVNDGSADDTAQLLKETFVTEKEVQIHSHTVNRGLGAAIRTGFEHATGDIVVTTDFDGTYDFATMPDLLQRIMQPGVDVVTASPYHPNGGIEGVPRYRLLFSFGASLVYRLLVRWRIYTWTSLFRAYRRVVVENVTFESNDFLAGTEILVNALQQGYTVEEFPTILHTRSFGQSSLRIASVTMAHMTYQLRLIRNALVRTVSRTT